MKQIILLSVGGLVLLAVIGFAIELFVIVHRGTPVLAPNIPRQAQTLGSGPALTYVVMGDSTSIGQGTTYNHSFAMVSAEYLARNHTVKFINVGISGAKAHDVVTDQLAKAVSYKPDVVVLAVGANDALRFSRSSTVETSLNTIVSQLKSVNPDIKIVVTGSPAMDSVPRFPFPFRQLMTLRTHVINTIFNKLVAQQHLIFAPIAQQTRQTFLQHPDYFASDEFHPNQQGYAIWIPIIDKALDQAVN